MKLCLFPQWDDLVSFMRNLSRHSAADICQRNFVCIENLTLWENEIS